MAKKKHSLDLSSRDITYESDEGSIKVLRFNPNAMTVDITICEAGQKVRLRTIPFAHLPKPIKRLVRPL